MAFKVVVTDYLFDNIDPFLKELKANGIQVAVYQEKNPHKLIPLVRDADAVFVHHTIITEEIINAMEHCKVIIRPALGVDNIDGRAAAKKGIYVANVPDYGAEYDVSDHVILLMLACVKKLYLLVKTVKSGAWDINVAKPIRRLRGQTLGLVGFGRIPKRVAKKAQALEMNVITYDPYIGDETATEYGVRRVNFDTLCRESDVISVTLQLSDETRGIISREAIAKMKPTAYIVNTSRGACIDEEALLQALREHRLAGAGLDVVDGEVLAPEHSFNKMDNVIVTPHSAWFSEDAEEALLWLSGKEILEVYHSGKPLHPCNSPVAD